MGVIPKRPRPASLSGDESVEAATPTPSWDPRGKERSGGGRVVGGHGGLWCKKWGVPCVGGFLQEEGVGMRWR